MKTSARFLIPIAAAVACAAVAAQHPPEQDPRPDTRERPEPVVEVATLGAVTRAPTKDEVETLGLKFEVRARGQLVTELVHDGPAVQAGVSVGDVIVIFGGVEVFSQDDIADVLRVSVPGKKLAASVLRAKSGKEGAVQIVLGSEEVKAPKHPPLVWSFASLVNLDAALAKAKQDKKKFVLVGLSGAET